MLKVSYKFKKLKVFIFIYNIYIFQSFAKATKQICGEQYPTLAFAIPIYNILINKLKDFRDTPECFEEGKVINLNFNILILNLIKTLYYYIFYSKQQIMLLTSFWNITIGLMHQ